MSYKKCVCVCVRARACMRVRVSTKWPLLKEAVSVKVLIKRKPNQITQNKLNFQKEKKKKNISTRGQRSNGGQTRIMLRGNV